MKQIISEFLRRGIAACCLGPLILAVLYLIVEGTTDVHTLTVTQVCTGIFSLSALAFLAGGMNVIYRMERLPLMLAILIHGCVLYVSYLAVYLINGWLKQGLTPILVFTGVFILGYLVIWVIIYSVTRQKTAHINHLLKEQQRNGPL